MRQMLIAPLMFFMATSAVSDEISFGAGAAALYSGFGINVALRGENHLGYVSAGCVAIGYSDAAAGWILPCGLGAGWLWTDWLTEANNRHGVGFYAGPVGYKGDNRSTAVYGLGITYEYFVQGVSQDGWNFGITPAIGKENGTAKGYLFLNAGYQF